MAFAALASLEQTINLILNYHQHSISSQVKNQITSINKHVIILQAFLEDFPVEANSFEGRIRMATHVAEDIIEFFMWEQIHDESCYEQWELKLAGKEIESIVEQVMEIKNNITVKDGRVPDSTGASSSPRVARVLKDAMVGFDEDLMEIKSRLCGGSSKREVVPIVGMGGIGKTTLARNAYDDQLIMEHFQIRAWVIVSQNFCVQEIVTDLLVSMEVIAARNKSVGAHKVYQNLKGMRYLIVLDDVWSVNAWDDLKMMFPDDGNGSRIMLTTRLSDVASYADSNSPPHKMQLMDEDHSWDLLRHKVFKQDPCPVELEYVGKMIAKSCRGLPLAIVVISGLLTVDQTKAVWENIAEDVKSVISANDEQLDKILSLSYTHLPHHLRPCFLYLAGLPEDYKMRVSIFIKLWVAEGFLKPANGCNKSYEETAEEYLEELVKRHLVLVTKRKSDGRIRSFSMHDLMREMCIRKSQEENFILHIRGVFGEGIKIPRRLCTSSHVHLDFPKNVSGSIIRTIIWLKHHNSWPGHLGHFRLLRVLDLLDSHEFDYEHQSLPDDVFKLFHLRYLACNCIFRVSDDISNLQNLQTLIIGPRIHVLETPPFFVRLSKKIWRMPQLRHLLFFGSLPFPNGETVALENLQTLSVATNLICAPVVLKMIPNLKKLGLFYKRSGDQYVEDYQLNNLIYLQQLENLKLEVGLDFPFREKVNPAFPRTLKKLTLSGLGLPWEDLNIVGSLPYLEVLKLRKNACVGRTWETTEGEFSQLKFLLINISSLQHWITESNHFPGLKCLVLRFCLFLSEIPDGIGEIPTLELIDVNYNRKSLLDSAKQIQDYQQSCGNDDLQVMAHKVV